MPARTPHSTTPSHFTRLFQHQDLRRYICFPHGVCAPYSLWNGGCSTHIAVVEPISATHRSSSPAMLEATPLFPQIRARVAQDGIYAHGVAEEGILSKRNTLAKQDIAMASSSSSVGTLERGKACLRCRSVFYLQRNEVTLLILYSTLDVERW